VTVEEEFTRLEDDFRRLKIEYEVYFNGGSPRPPRDTLYRVETMIKRYSSDQSKLNFGLRYRLTGMVQKYAVYTQLWRRKLQEKEEGRTLGGTHSRAKVLPVNIAVVRVVCSDPDAEAEKVSRLFLAMREAKRWVGENADSLKPAAFHNFVKNKTKQIKDTSGCTKVQFTVSVEEGKVKFRGGKAE
jgi:hypothetical protein